MQNVMAACNFDVQFIFFWVRWEGSACDTRIFSKTIDNPNIRFLKPPKCIEEEKSKCY
jgi:hypothetical protein